MAKKIVCYHYIVGAQRETQFRIRSIALYPSDPFPKPGFDSCFIPFPIENLLQFLRRKASKDLCANELRSVRVVNAFLRKAERPLRNVQRTQSDFQIWPCRA